MVEHQRWRLLLDHGPKSAYHYYTHADKALMDDFVETYQTRDHDSEVFDASELPTLKIDSKGVSTSITSLRKDFTLHFAQGEIRRRVHQKSEILCKVTGANRGKRITILDATAGLGREAYLMASCGAQVFAFERSLPLYLMIRDALTRSSQHFHLSFGDSMCGWHNIQGDIDVIYLDPMFPARTKQSSVGREAQILQAFATPDPPNSTQLLTWALDTAIRRVVVKRPIKATPLAGPLPTSAIKGKAIRFDIYGKRKLP